jgi:sRNA-binding carbon storage regulator CsrA
MVAPKKTQVVRTEVHTTTLKQEMKKKCHMNKTTKYCKKTESTSTKNRKETMSKEQKIRLKEEKKTNR